MPETAFDEVYKDGVLQSRTARTVTDAEIERRDAPAQLRVAVAALATWSDDAQAVADQSTTVTQAQIKALFGRFGQMSRIMRRLLITQGLDS